MDIRVHLEKRHLYFFTLLGLLIASIALVKGYGTNTPSSFGHSWGEIDCTSTMCVKDGTGKVGVGTQSPAAALHVKGDIILSREPVGERFILHAKPASKGERFYIAPDNTDGTWDWQGGLQIVRTPRELYFNNQRVCLQNGDGCSSTIPVYSCPTQASYQQCPQPSTCIGQLSMSSTCTYYTASNCQSATNSCQLVGYLTPT